MERSNLFTNTPSNPRVFSPLEDYVLHEMPGQLRNVHTAREELRREHELDPSEPLSLTDEATIHEELNTTQESRLKDAADTILSNTDPRIARLTQLDILFILGSRLPAGAAMNDIMPPILSELLTSQEQRFGLRPFMDYEMIVDYNSEEFERTGGANMRVYADGTDGLQERDFYLGHYLAEPSIKAAAYGLRKLVDVPDTAQADEILEEVRQAIVDFNGGMRRYARLDKQAFAYFRQYLAQYPDGTRNASGAFMPSVQLAELVLHAPTEQQQVHVFESMRYFPEWARPVLRQWWADSKDGKNILDMIKNDEIKLGGEGREILPGLLGVIAELRKFKHTHRQVTGRKIEGIFPSDMPRTLTEILEVGERPIMADGERGTAGFDPGRLLTNGIYRLVIGEGDVRKLQGGSAEQ